MNNIPPNNKVREMDLWAAGLSAQMVEDLWRTGQITEDQIRKYCEHWNNSSKRFSFAYFSIGPGIALRDAP